MHNLLVSLTTLLFLQFFEVFAHATPCDLSDNIRRVYVRDFHAVGDGKTDDGPALRAALKNVVDGPKPVALVFDADKTYRITSFEDTYALQLTNTQQITLHGNGAELLLLPPNKVLRLSNSADINVCGLTVDYSPLPFTQGMVVSTDAKTGTFDLEIEKGFDIPKTDNYTVTDNGKVWEFAVPYKKKGKFEKRVTIKTVHATSSTNRIRIVPEDRKQYLRLIPDQTHMVIAMPGFGQTGNFAFQIQNNERIHVEKLRVYAVPKMSFYIANNLGAVNFVNVEQRTRPGTTRVMTGWRDVFHVKDNRSPLLWDRCYIEGAFDDAFNLTAMYQLVIEKLEKDRWRLQDLGKDGAPIYKPGDHLQAIDLVPERKLLGETTIKSVIQNGPESIVTVSSTLPVKAGLVSCPETYQGCGSRVVNLNAANAGSIIRSCTIHGSVRLRANAVLDRCKLDGLLQITSSPEREGPLPTGVTVRDCELSGNVRVGSDTNTQRISSDNNTKEGWLRGERWAKNIVFQNNKISSIFRAEGASFSMFENDIDWPNSRKLELNNCGPVYIRNLFARGKLIVNPLSRISIGKNMTITDVVDK